MEEKKEIGTTMVGSLARLMSTSLKQLVTIAAENNISIILLNQERGEFLPFNKAIY
jgi:RecA/RadA recombinase